MLRWMWLLLVCLLSVNTALAQPLLPRQTYAPPFDTRQHYSDLIGSLTHYCVSTSAANTYTCTVDNGQGLSYSLVAGQLYVLTVINTNTGPATLNPNALGAIPLKLFVGATLSDVQAGDLPAGKQIDLRYDGAVFQVQNGPSSGGGGEVTLAGTQTLTNKEIVPRPVTLTDAATVVPNFDTTDMGMVLTLSQTTTFANPTGTATNGQRLLLRITSTTARTLVFGTAYTTAGLPLPTSTSGGGLTDYILFVWNATTSKLDYLGTTRPGLFGVAPASAAQVLVADSPSATTWRTLPNCLDPQHLTFATATNTFGCGAGASGVTTTRALNVAGTAGQVVTSPGYQDLSADRSWTVALASALTDVNGLTAQAAQPLTLTAGTGDQNVALVPTGTGVVTTAKTLRPTTDLGASSGTPSFRWLQTDSFIFSGSQATLSDRVIAARLLLTRTGPSGAPGTLFGQLQFECGTNAGTGKLVVYGGTSGTSITIMDNIGAGVSGC